MGITNFEQGYRDTNKDTAGSGNTLSLPLCHSLPKQLALRDQHKALLAAADCLSTLHA